MRVNPWRTLTVVLLLTTARLITGCSYAGNRSSQVQNLRAFAKLYGYVKYFHPSDEASEVPWDAFALHGVRQVLAVDGSHDLGETLQSLFAPIAPTVQIYDSKEAPPAPAALIPADTSGLRTVAWQHLGVSIGAEAPGQAYRSGRLNRPNVSRAASAGFGSVTQSVEAESHRGKYVRLRAFVRTMVHGAGNQGRLWLRVDREGGAPGFFDNMVDRPITSDDWERFEITGEVAEDATRIFFGCMLVGNGVVQVDDVEVHVRGDQGGWEPVEIENPGFELADAGGRPEGWISRSEGYEYSLDARDSHGGQWSLSIGSGWEVWSLGELFADHAAVGDVANKQLGAGLAAQIPLALYSDSAHTLGNVDQEALDALMSELGTYDLSRLTPENQYLRLADVIIAWNVLQHFYPYFDVVDTDWDAVLTSALENALNDETLEDFHQTLSLMVAALHDGHGGVYHDQLSDRAGLPFLVEWVEEAAVVTRLGDMERIELGDIVVSVDGAPTIEKLEDSEQYLSGSPQWKRFRAMSQFAQGESGSTVMLTLQRGDSSFTVPVMRTVERPSWQRTEPSIRTVAVDVFYVDLDRAEMTEISEHMEEIASARGVVFDLRGYPKGNHGVISHLLSIPDTSDAWMRVPRIIHPDRENTVGWEHRGWQMSTAEPHIQGTVVFLTDGRAISYAESFMSFIEHYRLAEIVGQPTAGTNGNVNAFRLPGGFRITWTGMRVVKHDGSQHHLVGILPTIPMTRTIAGVRAGRDELLERALEVIAGRTRQ